MVKNLYVDFQKCTGCKACVLACSLEKEKCFSPSKSRIWVAEIEAEWLSMPILCEQCDNPPCKAVCPTDAIIKDIETGIVKIDYTKCIGCKECMWICPFGAISYDPDTRRVLKCDLCDSKPACVEVCTPGALKLVPAKRTTLPKVKERLIKVLKTY